MTFPNNGLSDGDRKQLKGKRLLSIKSLRLTANNDKKLKNSQPSPKTKTTKKQHLQNTMQSVSIQRFYPLDATLPDRLPAKSRRNHEGANAAYRKRRPLEETARKNGR